MADTIFTSQTPASSDFDGQSHGWGMKFTVSAAGDCVGGRAWVPAPGRPISFFWQLWRVSDEVLLAESDLNAAGHGTPSSGAWMSFTSSLFTTPGDIALAASTDYVVNVWFDGGDGVFTDPGAFPVGSGGIVSSATGRFSNLNLQNQMPATDDDVYFFADVDVDAAAAVRRSPLVPVTAVQRSRSW